MKKAPTSPHVVSGKKEGVFEDVLPDGTKIVIDKERMRDLAQQIASTRGGIRTAYEGHPGIVIEPDKTPVDPREAQD